MALNTQSFSTIVSNAVAAVQGAASQLVDFTVGSISLALIQASAQIALWLEALILQVAALTRFTTSVGPDADTWAADYGFKRLGAVPAQGAVTFSRFTNTNQAIIPAAVNSGTDSNNNIIWTGGAVVQSADGTESFMVIPDTTQAAYNVTLNAYVIQAMVTSANATVVSTNAGTGGNIAAGLITVLGTSIPGVDTVTNALAFTDGQNAESDTAFKARFVLYLQSLTEGTPTAVRDAVLNLQEGAAVLLVENQNISGFFQASYFYCVCDDGSGNPSGTFLSNCFNAINAVRAVGTTFAVFPPTVVLANVSMVITVSSGYTLSAVEAQVIAALTAFINQLAIGATLPYTRLAQVAYDASPGVTNVSGVLLNGSTADLTVPGQDLIKAGTITCT